MKFKHVDHFIDTPSMDPGSGSLEKQEGETYAKWVLLLKRLPAHMQIVFAYEIDKFKLFCTHGDRRYRVTGVSRLGDVWLAEDLNKEVGYDLRVSIDACSAWSGKP